MLKRCSNNGCGDVCLWANPICPHNQPMSQPLCFWAELLLGNAEEFGVWPWTGSLCANHHFKFLQLPGAVHSSVQTEQPFQKKSQKQHGDSHHAIKYIKIYTHTHTRAHTKNGKIAFFGQGQPVQFDYLFSLVPHYPPPPPPTLALDE